MIDQTTALQILNRNRKNHIVIATMTSADVWKSISDTPMDFAYLPSTMGQGPSFGLGIALACPRRGVVVVNGDGCMLMNLGCLITIASNPASLYLIVVDNGVYGVTGGQKTAGSRNIDFAGIARSSGIKRSYMFDNANGWEQGASEALSGSGPVFIHLKISGIDKPASTVAHRPMDEQLARLRESLVAS